MVNKKYLSVIVPSEILDNISTTEDLFSVNSSITKEAIIVTRWMHKVINNEVLSIVVEYFDEEKQEVRIVNEPIEGNESYFVSNLLKTNPKIIIYIGYLMETLHPKREVFCGDRRKRRRTFFMGRDVFYSRTQIQRYCKEFFEFLLEFPEEHENTEFFTHILNGYYPYMKWAFQLLVGKLLKDNHYILSKEIELTVIKMIFGYYFSEEANENNALVSNLIKRFDEFGELALSMCKTKPAISLLYYKLAINNVANNVLAFPPEDMDRNAILVNSRQWDIAMSMCVHSSIEYPRVAQHKKETNAETEFDNLISNFMR